MLESDIVYIYTLADPAEPSIVRYVGKTVNPINRLSTHIYGAKNSGRKYHITNWVNHLLKENRKPVMSIIEKCNKDNWIEREKFYIKNYKDNGYSLCNLSEGGDWGNIHNIGKSNVSCRKPIMMLNKEGILLKEFTGVVEAAKYLDKNRHVIAACAGGKRPTAYGYKWKFKN